MSFVKNSAGVLISEYLYTANFYDCSFIMTKDVMLGSALQYQSVRRIKQRVVMVDLEFRPSESYSGSWSTDSDFYYIQQIFDNAELHL